MSARIPTDMSRPPLPVTVLTGFLGAGKTTLLNHLLHAPHGRRLGVLVNDFGAINIDAALVTGQTGEVLHLENGCICCTIQGSLLTAVLALLGRDDPPDHLIIEASGVADPFALAMTFMAPGVQPLLRLDAILAVVDAETALEPPSEAAAEVLEAQIRVANMVVLNKVDRIDAARRAAVAAWVRNLTPTARLLEASHGQVPLPFVLDIGDDLLPTLAARAHDHDDEHHDQAHHDPIHDHDEAHGHDHAAQFATWSYESDVPFTTLGDVKRALQAVPPTVFRAKGFLALEERPDHQTVVHLTGRRVAFTFAGPWETPPRTRLVFIGTPGTWSDAALDALFAPCLSAAGLFR